MIETNVSTLRIHKLTQEQYDRENEAGTLEENAIYITPEEEYDFSGFVKGAYTIKYAATSDNLPTDSNIITLVPRGM